jgi:hypothetical protein
MLPGPHGPHACIAANRRAFSSASIPAVTFTPRRGPALLHEHCQCSVFRRAAGQLQAPEATYLLAPLDRAVFLSRDLDRDLLLDRERPRRSSRSCRRDGGERDRRDGGERDRRDGGERDRRDGAARWLSRSLRTKLYVSRQSQRPLPSPGVTCSVLGMHTCHMAWSGRGWTRGLWPCRLFPFPFPFPFPFHGCPVPVRSLCPGLGCCSFWTGVTCLARRIAIASSHAWLATGFCCCGDKSAVNERCTTS